ncbi:hypothetical protein DUNSADRAFT_3353 [Dunaliella salina]|uniref:Uncharacterized protein n=1 Tax=Dunaliella salina TaxID=3046 RepID=A0ABQ7FVH8_DUNSA|nr:hypothetical protein DUNSADRAFT_3353 [Dunaliella salina]|eukprot:KAF5826380.1 hypothetical protein DUNSADRAFT_3353 [Dunaliella salina]
MLMVSRGRGALKAGDTVFFGKPWDFVSSAALVLDDEKLLSLGRMEQAAEAMEKHYVAPVFLRRTLRRMSSWGMQRVEKVVDSNRMGKVAAMRMWTGQGSRSKEGQGPQEGVEGEQEGTRQARSSSLCFS